jgi:hypothetical protein
MVPFWEVEPNAKIVLWHGRGSFLGLFEIAFMLVRFDHVARFIVKTFRLRPARRLRV